MLIAFIAFSLWRGIYVNETHLFYIYEIQERRIRLGNPFPPLRGTLSLGKRVFAFASSLCSKKGLCETFSLVTSFSPLRGMFSLVKCVFDFVSHVFTQ